MHILVTDQILEPWREIAEYQASAAMRHGEFGATAVFVGTTRDVGDSALVRTMDLEHYPGMTERHLHVIAEEAIAGWPLLDLLIVHRIGRLSPGDPIVVVATWSTHRAAALQACHFLIEELKHRAPFWKKECSEQGERWVETNTPGAALSGR